MLICPSCHGELTKTKNVFECRACHKKLQIKDGIILNIGDFSPDLQVSLAKWDDLYSKELVNNDFWERYERYREIYFPDVYRQLASIKSIKGIVYLEIGCGELFLGQTIAKDCAFIIGIDMSATALDLAHRMLKEKKIVNYLLIQGDINHMPISANSVDLIYGGGVIEHFKDTHTCLAELYRVLKRGGTSFNTVPLLNLGSLTYRQLWGNIPNTPVIKQIAEFIHMKLLSAKHMIFGYEMSFPGATLKRLHKAVGFRKVSVDRFTIHLSFDFLPAKLRPLFVYLATHSPLFWPMVKVIATK